MFVTADKDIRVERNLTETRDFIEIYLKLWEECNNNCKFCNQKLTPHVNIFTDEYKVPSLKAIKTNIDKLENFLFDKFLNSKEYFKICIDIMGGELFHRADIPELFEGFEYLADKIKNIIIKFETSVCDIEITVFSNLLYEDLTLIKFFYNKFDSKYLNRNIKNYYTLSFNTSFDFFDRFDNESKVDLFCKNIIKLYNDKKYFKVKGIITKNVLKNYNKELYTVKKFNEIKHLFLEIFIKNYKHQFYTTNNPNLNIELKNTDIFRYNIDSSEESFEYYKTWKQMQKDFIEPYKENKFNTNLIYFFPLNKELSGVNLKLDTLKILTGNNNTHKNIIKNSDKIKNKVYTLTKVDKAKLDKYIYSFNFFFMYNILLDIKKKLNE